MTQTGFSHGLLYDASRRQYYIFASPAMTVVYGYGKGADYIGKNYLKETSGLSAMSSLGGSDITMTAAVLENLSVKPDVKDKNIIIRFDNRIPILDKFFSLGIARK